MIRFHLATFIALVSGIALSSSALSAFAAPAAPEVRYFPVPAGGRPHDVAPDPRPNGPVWYTAQGAGQLGRLDPTSGRVELIPLGPNSAPHGVIVAADGAPWITDGGQNAIVRVDPATRAVRLWRLPEATGYANLNTATFDRNGAHWFTGQRGVYGKVDPRTNEIRVWEAPRGPGAYGIATTPDGQVFYASLAGSHIARIDVNTGQATVIEPPTPRQGARRVWSDSRNRVWVSEWNSGQVSVYDTRASSWKAWKLPGANPRAYSVYVDEQDNVWLTDFNANAIVRFHPDTERFDSFPSDRSNANVRQMLGRRGEAWGAESGTDRLVVVRY